MRPIIGGHPVTNLTAEGHSSGGDDSESVSAPRPPGRKDTTVCSQELCMTMPGPGPGWSANRRPRVVARRSPRIINSRFYKGGRGARSDSKAADGNYDH